MTAGTVVFVAVLVVLAYHYLGYPITLAVIAALRRDRPVQPGTGTPTVTLIVSAYNEEDVLRTKLENALALDYPADRLEIVVASDGSTDRTVAIAREFADRGVVVHEYRTNRGKNAALNDTVPLSRGEIVVFTDANGRYRPDAMRRLVAYFDDARVGSVCGELIYLNYSRNPVAEGYNRYWRFDQLQKRLESRLHTLLGANGSIFAVRRGLYRPLPNTVCNDMVLPILIAAAGHAVVYAPDAVSTEAGSADLREELRRRSRIIARGILGVRAVAGEVLGARRWLLGWELLWRKAVRYAMPLWFLLLLGSSAFLPAPLGLLFVVQVAGWLAAPVVTLLPQGRLRRLASPALYLGVGTLAALLAWVQLFAGRDFSRWETVSRPHEQGLDVVGSGSMREAG
jgi:cellulose synthase/poly-beta-1,6-N-acetylglucosamine synthase-like glycosyltransferase